MTQIQKGIDDKTQSQKGIDDKTQSQKGIDVMTQIQKGIYVLRAEELCYALRDALIDFSLKYPSHSTFERYLGLITDEGDLKYIIKLLHECWLFANPYYLFNGLLKDPSAPEMIERVLSTYSNGFDYLKEAFTPGINHLWIEHYNNYVKSPEKQLAYEDYLNELFRLTENICQARDIKLREGFVIDNDLGCNISYSEQERVYDMAVENKLFDDTKGNRQTFFSLFSTSPEEPRGQIRWMVKNEKNEDPSYATLYEFFEAIGVDMHSRREKEIICKHFLDCYGQPIKVNQLKFRKPSDIQKDLAQKVKQALQES